MFKKIYGHGEPETLNAIVESTLFNHMRMTQSAQRKMITFKREFENP